MKYKPRNCWDSCAFLAWFKREEHRLDKVQAVIDAAKAGELVIVTSTLAIAETLWVRGEERLSTDKRETVRAFFRHPWIVSYEVDRTVAELAQDVVWDYGVKPKDAIHVATALSAKVDRLETFDAELIAMSDTIGVPPLKIAEPGTGLTMSLLTQP